MIRSHFIISRLIIINLIQANLLRIFKALFSTVSPLIMNYDLLLMTYYNQIYPYNYCIMKNYKFFLLKYFTIIKFPSLEKFNPIVVKIILEVITHD